MRLSSRVSKSAIDDSINLFFLSIASTFAANSFCSVSGGMGIFSEFSIYKYLILNLSCNHYESKLIVDNYDMIKLQINSEITITLNMKFRPKST